MALLLTLGLAWAQQPLVDPTPTPPPVNLIPTPPPPPPPPPTVEGRVVDDLNGNGLADANEPGIPNVMVTDGVATVRTDNEGRYKFERSRTARYLQIRIPAGYYVTRFYSPLKTLTEQETAQDVVDFPMVRDKRELPEDAPTFAHVVDVRPWRMPDAPAAQRLKTALEHVKRLRPQPRVLVVAGGIQGCQDRVRLIDSMRADLPPVRYVFVRTHDELTSFSVEGMYEATCGPTHYSFETGKTLCLVGTDAVEEELKLSGAERSGAILVVGRSVQTMDGEKGSRVLTTPSAQGNEFPGRYRLLWADGQTRMVWPTAAPVFRWVYPVSGSRLSCSRLYLLATAYDSTDAHRVAQHEKEGWRFARLGGEPGRMGLEEVDVTGRTLAGVVRRELAKPGPFLDPAKCVCQLWGLPGLAGAEYTTSFEALGEDAVKCDLSTPWSGPGGNDLHTGTAPVTVTPPLVLEGWGRFAGSPRLVMEGKFLVPGREIAGSWRWAEPKRTQTLEDGAFESGRHNGNPVMNDEFICWVNDSGELVSMPTAESPSPEAVNPLVKRRPLSTRPLDDCRGLTPSLVDNVAMVVLPTREAVAIDLRTQRELWRVPVKDWCLSPVGTQEGFILGNECLSVRTGKPAWTNVNIVTFVRSQVSLLGRRVVVSGLADENKPGRLTEMVACYETNSGKLAWQMRLAEVDSWEDIRTPGAVFGAGLAYVGSSRGMMTAIDLETGQKRWEQATGASVLGTGARITARAVFSEGVLYFAGHDGVVVGLDARKGKKLFSYDLGMPVTDDLVVSGNTLLVGTCDGLLFWFKPTTVEDDLGNP
jgi:hypothetical protein